MAYGLIHLVLLLKGWFEELGHQRDHDIPIIVMFLFFMRTSGNPKTCSEEKTVSPKIKAEKS